MADAVQNRSGVTLKMFFESVMEPNKPFRQAINIIDGCISKFKFAFLVSLCLLPYYVIPVIL